MTDNPMDNLINDLTNNMVEDLIEELIDDLPDMPIIKLSRSLRESSKLMSREQARYLVNAYYQMQNHRIRANQQLKAENSNDIMQWMFENTKSVENMYKSALMAYSQANEVGRWSMGITGIGPVFSSALLAYIDIEKCANVGKLWRYAGQDPTAPKPEKGQTRVYNAKLKRVCWLIGESFVKFQNNEKDVYGHKYVIRKERENARNVAKMFADQAAIHAERVGKTTTAYEWYSQGMLPPAHIHARAKRWAVKLFLSHWHYVAFTIRYGISPERPYILTQPEHTHMIMPPNWPIAKDEK